MDKYTEAIIYLSDKKMSCFERLMAKKLLLIEQNLTHNKLTGELIDITKQITSNEEILDNIKQAEDMIENIKLSYKSNAVLNLVIGFIVGLISFFLASSFGPLLFTKVFIAIVATVSTIAVETLIDDFKYTKQTKELRDYLKSYSYNDVYVEKGELEHEKAHLTESLKYLKNKRLMTTRSIQSISEVISILNEHINKVMEAKNITLRALGDNVTIKGLNEAYDEDQEIKRVMEKERKIYNDN